MSKYVLDPMNTKAYVYDLCGVINHLGHSLSMGHYTAFVRTHHTLDSTQDELGWRLFDDSRVVKIDNPTRVVTHDAYVLMYRLRQQQPQPSSTAVPTSCDSPTGLRYIEKSIVK